MQSTLILTGDPFVDAGKLAYQSFFPELDESTKLNRVLDIYIKKWHNKLNAIFLNSAITQPNFSDNRKKEETIKYFTQFNDSETKSNCRVCGKEQKLRPLSRSGYPLSGSGKFVNYHHSFSDGILACKECTLSLFFLPLAVMYIGGKLALLHIQNIEQALFWQAQTIEKILYEIAAGHSQGIYKSKYSNPQNALFYFAHDLIKFIKNHEDENTQFIRFYHFTNFGASVDCDIFELPNSVFRFFFRITHIQQNGRELFVEWKNLTRSFFKIKAAKYDEMKQSWVNEKNDTPINDEDVLNSKNVIYNYLYNKKYSHVLTIMKKKKVSFELVKIYVLEVLDMKKERVERIKVIADKLVEFMVVMNDFKKILRSIEGAGRAAELRRVLIQLLKHSMKFENTELLFTTDDFILNLFPDNEPWSYTRDLLLVRIYEQLHLRQINFDGNDQEEMAIVLDESEHEE